MIEKNFIIWWLSDTFKPRTAFSLSSLIYDNLHNHSFNNCFQALLNKKFLKFYIFLVTPTVPQVLSFSLSVRVCASGQLEMFNLNISRSRTHESVLMKANWGDRLKVFKSNRIYFLLLNV
ncbi:hypothetical protein BpHYR1_023060 [Brachionus plicatilis]|uniref:Uncharacterized protein n=1 Tax=Brachionus plicatilis TaxID=10195 RepID=A0A3M7SLH5_BRAPC|nr:hypothetical protein BpHYR1_023060 [Brachionus plicatilis]